MSATEQRKISLSVRALAEFCAEGGDLTPSGSVRRMLEGAQAHRGVQKTYGPGWKAEVPLARDIDLGGLTVALQGRADGVCLRGGDSIVEEIKSTADDPSGLTGGEYPAHWLQALFYAAILVWREGLGQVTVRLKYVGLTGGEAVFERRMEASALEDQLQRSLAKVAKWLKSLDREQTACRASMKALAFPYARFRPGQRAMAANVYVALRDGKNLLCQAPTGTGKTAAALFPALKALGEGLVERVFYLTARTTGREAAAAALRLMADQGLEARCAVITARDSVCPMPVRDCRPEVCPRAKGYYDRRRAALYEALSARMMDRPAIEALAEKHALCPFELSLDLSETCDVILCDYNYVFDPRVRLQRFFQGRSDSALLVDEAHNLAPRTRDMLSASISAEAVAALRRALGREVGRRDPLYRALSDILRAMEAMLPDDGADRFAAEPPDALIGRVKAFVSLAGPALERPLMARADLADRYFECVDFLRAAEAFSERWQTLIEPCGRRRVTVTIFCADPSDHIARCLRRVHGAALFSATVSPMPFYRDTLGLSADGDALLSLPSPYPPENQLTLIMSLPLRYREREGSIMRLSEALSAFISAKKGNYLICFPSYAFMNRVLEAGDFTFNTLIQTPDMDEAARRAFLDELKPEPQQTTAAFVVMGGIFAEGIDLKGSRLIGAAIVGTGVPQISVRGDALRALFERTRGAGYAYAYMYPGLTRVLQAAGRVIRDEDDRGAVLLIDERWDEAAHRALLPPHWRPVTVRDADDLRGRLKVFWNSEGR